MRDREVEVLDNFVVLSILSMMADSRCIRLQRDCSRFRAACVRQGKNDVKFFSWALHSVQHEILLNCEHFK